MLRVAASAHLNGHSLRELLHRQAKPTNQVLKKKLHVDLPDKDGYQRRLPDLRLEPAFQV